MVYLLTWMVVKYLWSGSTEHFIITRWFAQLNPCIHHFCSCDSGACNASSCVCSLINADIPTLKTAVQYNLIRSEAQVFDNIEKSHCIKSALRTPRQYHEPILLIYNWGGELNIAVKNKEPFFILHSVSLPAALRITSYEEGNCARKVNP